MLLVGGCYEVSLAYFLLLHYYSGRAVAESICWVGGREGYVSGGWWRRLRVGWVVAEAMCRVGGCGGYVSGGPLK